MAETVADPVSRYILEGGDDDLRRLLAVAELFGDMARRAFWRVGVQKGWRVLECGCGPIGALAVLAELVGATGEVVGLDFGERAVERARSVVGTLGLDNVQIHVGDVHDADVAELGGPFDLAYSRLFLMHQSDPARTLSRIATLLRPGGWIIAQEPLRTPAPQSYAQLDALSTYWERLHKLMEWTGVPPRSVDDLPRVARAAGLEVGRVEGFFTVMEPEVALDIHAATLAAARDRATQSGIATEHEIDELLETIRAAKTEGYQWVTSPFFLDLALRKPIVAEGSVPEASYLAATETVMV